MVRITIDDELRRKLMASPELVELVDEAGEVICRIFPEARRVLETGRFVPPLPSEEELERRLAYDGTGISTEELIRRLRAKP